jgi:hypothetical protein
MALNTDQIWWSQPSVDEQEYAIKGEMIITELLLSEFELLQFDPNSVVTEKEIKKRLLMKLMDELANSKSVEFTKMDNIINGSKMFRARIFAVPDDHVKILRMSQKNNTTT